MSKFQAVELDRDLEEAAIKAVFVLQYNTAKAVRFVCSEVPSVTNDMATKAIGQVARPSAAALKSLNQQLKKKGVPLHALVAEGG